jgi:hypothetical protein
MKTDSMRFLAFTATVAFAWSQPVLAREPLLVSREQPDPSLSTIPEQEQRATGLWSRISESFSPFPLGVPTALAVVGRLRNGDVCGPDTETWCEVEGENGVLHIFDSQDVLRIKLVEVGFDEASPPAIDVLGIGLARKRADVMRRVAIFAPELKFTCGDHAEYTEDEGSTLCQASIPGHGTVDLIFNASGKLWLVRQFMPSTSEASVVVS